MMRLNLTTAIKQSNNLIKLQIYSILSMILFHVNLKYVNPILKPDPCKQSLIFP